MKIARRAPFFAPALWYSAAVAPPCLRRNRERDRGN